VLEAVVQNEEDDKEEEVHKHKGQLEGIERDCRAKPVNNPIKNPVPNARSSGGTQGRRARSQSQCKGVVMSVGYSDRALATQQ
jgi:hypothetical protein